MRLINFIILRIKYIIVNTYLTADHDNILKNINTEIHLRKEQQNLSHKGAKPNIQIGF